MTCSCDNNEISESVQNDLDSSNHIETLSGYTAENNHYFLQCDNNNYGVISTTYPAYEEQYIGYYSRSIMIPQFDFVPEQSLAIKRIKSPEYIKDELLIRGNGGFDSVQIKIQYLNLGFDTTCTIYDTLNLIPMRTPRNYEDEKIMISFNFLDFNFGPQELNYNVSGIAIDDAKPIDTIYFCHFSTSDGDSLIVHAVDYKCEPRKDYYDTFSTD